MNNCWFKQLVCWLLFYGLAFTIYGGSSGGERGLFSWCSICCWSCYCNSRLLVFLLVRILSSLSIAEVVDLILSLTWGRSNVFLLAPIFLWGLKVLDVTFLLFYSIYYLPLGLVSNLLVSVLLFCVILLK